jgi:hypothetical protein
MMDRNPKASLSLREINALRMLERAPGRPIASGDRRLFLSMGLAVSDGETLRLSDAGRARLEWEQRIDGGGMWSSRKPESPSKGV